MKEVKPVEVVTVADDSDDGWGELVIVCFNQLSKLTFRSPIKNMEIKAPVSKSAAVRLKQKF